MGSFAGHVVPGSFFAAFSFWWLYNILYRYLYSRRFKPNSYKNSSSFPSPCSKRVPVESVLKVVAATVGILGEFVTSFDKGVFTHWGNVQHITMFFFFGLNGMIDLLYYKGWVLPKKLDYVTAILAFAIEGFLFYHHLHGRAHMDIQVHMFLFYVTMACAISTLVEMYQPTNPLPALCRTFFTMLQGSWFYQVGFILYSPFGQKWDVDDHEQIMIVTFIFTWHVAAIFIFMLGVGTLIWHRVKNSSGSSPMYQMLDTNEPPNSKEIFEENGNIQHPYSNGHIPFDKSGRLDHILDSDSEEA